MKSKQQRRAEAIRSSERHARESMRALGATEAHWRDAELHAINAWPGQAEDFGASPKAMAFVRSMWCEWLREDRNPAMKFAHGVARAAAGYPIDLHLSSSHETAEQESFNAFGSEPFDVQAEARNTLRTSAAWAVIAAIDGFNDIESESVTALVRSSIVAPVCGDDDTAQHVLTARVARFARELRPALNLPDLAGRTLFGRVGPDAASARMPIAARYVLDSLEAEVWPWDAALADALRALGRNGAEAATAILERSRQRMASAREAVPVRMPTLHMQALGFDSPPWDNRGDMLAQWVTADVGGHPLGMPWVSLVAWALWHDEVKPERDRAHAPRVAAVAPRVVVEAGIRAMGAERLIMSSTLPQTLVGQRGDGPEYPISLALVTSGAVQAVLGDITNGSDDHLWLVFDWVVRAVHQQEQGGVPSPHIITVRGGKDGLRQAVGVASKGQADSVFNALHTLHLLSVVGASKGEPRLLSYSIEQPRGRPARGRPEKLIVIDVGWAMMPHGAAKLGLADRWKVAILPPAYRPEVGRRTTGSRQANAYQSLSLIALEHRREIAREGAFRLTADEWNHHADAAGLYRRSHASLGRDVFDAYLAPPPAQLALGCRPRTGPILVPVEKGSDWYRFGPDFQPEWEHYRQAGDFSEGQAARGEANTAKVVAAAAKARKAKAAKRKREG